MKIIKSGDTNKSKQGEFHFTCKHCGCEWYGDRSDEGLRISPPCMPFYTSMKCPNCDKTTYDRDIRFI